MDKRFSIIGLVIMVLLMGVSPAQAAIPEVERQALIALYNSTNGPGWADSSNWRTADGTDFAAPGTECTWVGVACTGDSVTELFLINNRLSGSIPKELGELSNLLNIDLSFNQLSGVIPPELGNLSNLQNLGLYSNDLSGSIPVELGQLSNLQMLVLYSNRLSGNIPEELGQLSNLNRLWLDSNELSGIIPPELGNLSNLQSLDLDSNQLSGPIPVELGNLSNLRDLGLNSNDLSGSIPAELGNISNLENLILSSNQLSGPIPVEFGNLLDLNPSSTDLGYNALYTNDPALGAFLVSKDSDWDQTQTIAPVSVSVSEATTSSVVLSWTPIEYTADVGNYGIFPDPAPPGESIFHDGFEGGDTEWWGIGNPWVTTTDKSDISVLVDGLDSGTSYDFVIRTVTEPHGEQQNEVISGPSATVSETTAQ